MFSAVIGVLGVVVLVTAYFSARMQPTPPQATTISQKALVAAEADAANQVLTGQIDADAYQARMTQLVAGPR